MNAALKANRDAWLALDPWFRPPANDNPGGPRADRWALLIGAVRSIDSRAAGWVIQQKLAARTFEDVIDQMVSIFSSEGAC